MIKIKIKHKDRLSFLKKVKDSKLIVKVIGNKEKVKNAYEAIEGVISKLND